MAHRRGEEHPKAAVSDEIVAEIRFLKEAIGLRYKQIVEMMRERGIEVTYRAVRKWCTYERR